MVWGIPIKGNQCTLYLVAHDVREEPGGALDVQAPPIVLPSTGVMADVIFSNGWERPKQAGWEFRGR